MQLDNLKPIHFPKKYKRVGRGGKRGTYSGRGGKGQTARAGFKTRPAIRDFMKKIPKMKGGLLKKAKEKYELANLAEINNKFKDGELVSPLGLSKVGLIKKGKNVKILGQGQLEKKLIFQDLKFSKTAKDKIIKSGGQIK